MRHSNSSRQKCWRGGGNPVLKFDRSFFFPRFLLIGRQIRLQSYFSPWLWPRIAGMSSTGNNKANLLKFWQFQVPILHMLCLTGRILQGNNVARFHPIILPFLPLHTLPPLSILPPKASPTEEKQVPHLRTLQAWQVLGDVSLFQNLITLISSQP